LATVNNKNNSKIQINELQYSILKLPKLKIAFDQKGVDEHLGAEHSLVG
jgi:hypothetical protein